MTTQEVANKWKEYCTTGRWDLAHAELYDQNCESCEMEGFQGGPQKVVGMDAIKMKGEKWNEMVEEFHGIEIEGPIVSGNHFTATMNMDVTMKGRPRSQDPEVCVFRVENGKIVSEKFFYEV